MSELWVLLKKETGLKWLVSHDEAFQMVIFWFWKAKLDYFSWVNTVHSIIVEILMAHKPTSGDQEEGETEHLEHKPLDMISVWISLVVHVLLIVLPLFSKYLSSSNATTDSANLLCFGLQISKCRLEARSIKFFLAGLIEIKTQKSIHTQCLY